MRKIVFFSFVLVGAVAGYIWGLNERWPTTLVLMGICMLFTGSLGGALSIIGRKPRISAVQKPEVKIRNGLWSKDIAANHWRDEGHPPFMKPKNEEHVSTHKHHSYHKW